MKKNVLRIVKIISFFLVMAALLEVLSVTAFSKEKGGNAYRNKLNKTYSFYTEPDNTIQLIGIGNSDLYSGFVPTKLFEDYGYTSQMTGSPYQTPLQSYYYLREILKYQSPEVVMIETDMLYDELPGEQEPEKNALDVLFNYADTADFEAMIADKLPVFTFHDRWKSVINRDTKMRTPNSHGYKYFSAISDVKIEPYMFETDKSEPVHKNRLRQFDMLVELCREHGAQVFFIEMPTTTSWNYERHNAAAEIAKGYGADFIDLNLCVDEMKLDLDISFRDKGNHLNYAGACTVTEYLGEYIKNTFDLEDRRKNPDYDFWKDSVKAFAKEMKKEDKRRAEQDEE